MRSPDNSARRWSLLSRGEFQSRTVSSSSTDETWKRRYATIKRQIRVSALNAPRILLITDPGPDPDDIKSLLTLWAMHNRGALHLIGVVCNGGGQPEARARLVRCILHRLGTTDIPVAVGSCGKPYESLPHEYLLDGYNDETDVIFESGDVLIDRVLRDSIPSSVICICISSLRDLADAIERDANLVSNRISRVAIMGGLDVNTEAPFGYVPDTSVNNQFDPDAAQSVYEWCFANGVPMSVVSRHAVPMLSMQLARSFAERTSCSIMRYLANAQFLGLEGLWHKLCEGKLPVRCSKEWFFDTFCGINSEEFNERRLYLLGINDPIIPRLNGFVKPYDVIAVLAALPWTISIFVPSAYVAVRAIDGTSCTHLLLLDSSHMINIENVQRILRETYHDVVIASNRDMELPVSTRLKSRISISAHHDLKIQPTYIAVRDKEGLLDMRVCAHLLQCLQHEFRRQELFIYRAGASVLAIVTSSLIALVLWSASTLPTTNEATLVRPTLITEAVIYYACATGVYSIMVVTIGMLQPVRPNRWAMRVVYMIVAIALLLVGLFNVGTIKWSNALSGVSFYIDTIARIVVGASHIIVSCFLLIKYPSIGRESLKAQWRLWIVSGFHFAARLVELILELVPIRDYASEFLSIVGFFRLVLFIELAFLVILTAWPRSLAYVRKLCSRIVNLVVFYMRGRNMQISTNCAPIGMTALLHNDFASSDICVNSVAEKVGKRLKMIEVSTVTVHSILFEKTDMRTRANLKTRARVRPSGGIIVPRNSTTFDFFVVHSCTDDPVLRANALGSWVENYQKTHNGRCPTMWIDTICSDTSRSKSDQLADLPFILGRSRRLLLICSPTTINTLRCAIELYVWQETGGGITVDDIHIALIGEPCITYPQLITAFDFYHAMYASVEICEATDELVVEQLISVVERARISIFNEKVRAFLPVIRLRAAVACPIKGIDINKPSSRDSTQSDNVKPRVTRERKLTIGKIVQNVTRISRTRNYSNK